MGAIIELQRKEDFLIYIQNDFGKISQREIARRLGVGKTTVNRWSKEVGLFFRKHTVNENFFDTWNNEMAYVLGYIITDGNISWNTVKGYYSMTITAAAKDVDHLEAIRCLLKSTKPLLYSASTNSYRLIVNSKIVCRRLMQFGIIPNKSLVVRIPQIPYGYICHFLRGVVDGDGNVRFVNRKRSPYFEISIASGSLLFCHDLMTVIKKELNIDGGFRHQQGNTYVVQYSCRRAFLLGNWIYNHSTIHLERKFTHFKNSLEYYFRHGKESIHK